MNTHKRSAGPTLTMPSERVIQAEIWQGVPDSYFMITADAKAIVTNVTTLYIIIICIG